MTTPQRATSPDTGLRRFPPVQALLRTRWVRRLQHAMVVRWEPRRAYTFTRFLRLPTQYDALAGPVIDFLAPAGTERELAMVNVGCSLGAQPYSSASVLLRRRPGLRFHIRAFDINPEMIDRARAGRYAERDVFATPGISREFVAATFDRDGDDYVVKPEIAHHVTFAVADALDPALGAKVGTTDVLRCQNLIVNLPVAVGRRALANVLTLLRPRSAVLLDGVPLGMRAEFTRREGLTPLDYEIETIHNEALLLHGDAWPWHYWGLEPFDGSRRDWRRRYATVFLKGA